MEANSGKESKNNHGQAGKPRYDNTLWYHHSASDIFAGEYLGIFFLVFQPGAKQPILFLFEQGGGVILFGGLV